MDPLQVHAARLAAGEREATELVDVCKRAGVTICRYPVPASKMKVGDTLAVGVLRRLLARHGADCLAAALKCITKTRKGNAGMVRAPIVAALCQIFEAEPDWRASEKKMLAVMGFFNLSDSWVEAGQKSYSERRGMTAVFLDMITDHFEARFAERVAS